MDQNDNSSDSEPEKEEEEEEETETADNDGQGVLDPNNDEDDESEGPALASGRVTRSSGRKTRSGVTFAPEVSFEASSDSARKALQNLSGTSCNPMVDEALETDAEDEKDEDANEKANEKDTEDDISVMVENLFGDVGMFARESLCWTQEI